MIAKAAQQDYSRDEVRRMLEISARQLREWQRQKLIRETDQFSFADLIALRTVQKLRENRVPARRIARALESLKKKLAGVEQPLSELKIVSNGRSIEVQVAGQKMEPITGQMLFDFDTAGLDNLKPFPGERVKEPSSRLSDERQAELWFQRGLDLEERGAPVAEAIAAYEKAIAHNPNAAGALVNLGTIYYHLRRYPEAEAQYQRAIEVDARYPLAQFNLGNLYDECSDFEKAREHYAAALKLNPNYGDAHYNMALLCEKLGDYMKATRHWKSYLKIDASSSWATIARRQLEKIRHATVVHGGPERAG